MQHFQKRFGVLNNNNKYKGLTQLDGVDYRQVALSIICSILSDLVYVSCDDMLNSSVLLTLGLSVRACYSGEKSNKFILLTKSTPEDRQLIQNLQRENRQVQTETDQYIKTLQGQLPYQQGEVRQLILQNMLKKAKDHNIVNAEFTKPLYSPKLTEVISNYIHFGTASGNESSIANYITDDDLFVVFRGTQNRDNLFTDLQIQSTPIQLTGGIGQFHTGFVNAYNNIETHLTKAIGSYINKTQITFTGHSLGAALASLASIDFSRRLEHYYHTYQIGLVTFGSPRITDETGSQYFTDLLVNPKVPLRFNIRYCNALDPVVYFKPPNISRLKNPYRHLLSLININGQPQLFTSVVFTLDRQTLTNMVFNYYERRYKGNNLVSKTQFLKEFGNNIVTHFMGNYIINLLNHLPKDILQNEGELGLTINNLNQDLMAYPE